MLWIVALAAAALVGSIARNAWQDHRDAELQRRDALDDIARPRSPRKQRALPTGERVRLAAADAERAVRPETPTDERPVVAPPVVAPPRPMGDSRTPTPPFGARVL